MPDSKPDNPIEDIEEPDNVVGTKAERRPIS